MKTRQLLLDKARWVSGWMSIEELSLLAEISQDLRPDSFIYEVGSFCGRSARVIADNSPDSCRLYCVDPWNYEIKQWDKYGNPIQSIIVDDSTFEHFKLINADHIDNDKIVPVRCEWHNFPFGVSADFIFLDGNHDYEAVCEDIIKAKGLITHDGIIAGHDYTNFEDVFRAVNEHFQKYQIEVRDTIWLIRPTKF